MYLTHTQGLVLSAAARARERGISEGYALEGTAACDVAEVLDIELSKGDLYAVLRRLAPLRLVKITWCRYHQYQDFHQLYSLTRKGLRNVARFLVSRASRYRLQGRHSEAEECYKRLIRVFERYRLKNHRLFAHVLGQYARFLRSLDRGAEADAIEKQASEVRALRRVVLRLPADVVKGLEDIGERSHAGLEEVFARAGRSYIKAEEEKIALEAVRIAKESNGGGRAAHEGASRSPSTPDVKLGTVVPFRGRE